MIEEKSGAIHVRKSLIGRPGQYVVSRKTTSYNYKQQTVVDMNIIISAIGKLFTKKSVVMPVFLSAPMIRLFDKGSARMRFTIWP